MSEFENPSNISSGKNEDLLVHAPTETHTTTNSSNDNPKEVLKRLACPYNWKLDDIKASPFLVRDIRFKLFERSQEIKDSQLFDWYSCCLEVLLSYLLTKNGEFTEAIEVLDNLSDKLKELEDASCDEPFFIRIKDSVWQVIYASQLFTLIMSESIDDDNIKKVMKKIKDISDMTDTQKSVFFGIKTCMLLHYGHDGNILALESAKTAKDLDPEMAEWWFLIGKAMGRIRRVVDRFQCIDKEEVKMLEKAIELEDSPSYIVYLAQTYMECAKRAFQKFRSQVDLKTHDLGKHIDTLNKKSLNLFMQAVEKKSTSASTLSRCANGLLRLPPNYKNVKLAEELLKKSLAINPNNSYAHHVAGYLYHNIYPFDYEKALSYYEKASELSNYGASMDMIRLRGVLNPSYDPYEDLLKFKDKYRQEVYQTFLDCEMGSYFLYKKRDLPKALEYYSDVLKNEKASLLKSNFMCVLHIDGPVNLLKIALDEARLALQSTESLTNKDKTTIRKFIILVTTHAPELLDVEPEINQVEKILQKSHTRNAKLKNSGNKWNKTGPFEQNEKLQGNYKKKSVTQFEKVTDNTRYERRNKEETYGKEKNEIKPLLRDAKSNYKLQSWRTEEHDKTNWKSQADNKHNYQRQHNVCNKEQLQNRCWRTERRLNNKNEPTDFMTETTDKEGKETFRFERSNNRGDVKSRAESNFGQNWRREERDESNWRSKGDKKDSYERQHFAGNMNQEQLQNHHHRTQESYKSKNNKSEQSDEKETYRFPVTVVPKEK